MTSSYMAEVLAINKKIVDLIKNHS